MLAEAHPVDWWFVFKLNAAIFPGCAGNAERTCIFGGEPVDSKPFGQQFVYASSEEPQLQEGSDCAGDTQSDPIGATYSQAYFGSANYVVWNDQFYDDPKIAGCNKFCDAPWGHSKGILAWDDSGAGFVMQVSTPDWPAAGSKNSPRKSDGNTLGCIAKDNNVKVSQHFFALRLNKDDVIKVVTALQNSSVVTDVSNPQVVRNGGPDEIKSVVAKLGVRSDSKTFTKVSLSTGVQLISKPSALLVPPWQMVSAVLGGISLRTATWWANPDRIYTTTATSTVTCWNNTLPKPGPVEIATTGQWDGKQFGLIAGGGANLNHAKIGVALSGSRDYAIFGDMNQEGSLSGNCDSHQNSRGGLFFVVDNANLSTGLQELMSGDTAPTAPGN